jgi:hypothetical protein
MTLTAGSSQITVALTAPTLPTGWTVTKAYAAAIRDQNPQTEAFYNVTAAEDAAAPWSIVLTGLTPTEPYLVGGWFQFTRPDGTFAYGQSLQDFETPTA